MARWVSVCLQRASRELNAADERTLQNATLSVRARFAHLLTVLMDRYGIENEDADDEDELFDELGSELSVELYDYSDEDD